MSQEAITPQWLRRYKAMLKKPGVYILWFQRSVPDEAHEAAAALKSYV